LSPVLDKKHARIKRHNRVKKRVSGTSERPRLCVFKSLKHTYAQIVDDVSGTTVLTVSTLSSDIRD